MKLGLCSVTFRKKPIQDVAKIARDVGLFGIEWGGDIHVPHGDEVAALLARQASADSGLEIVSYGSYFRGETGEDIQPVITSAKILGVNVIRIWAGSVDFEKADKGQLETLVENIKTAAQKAAEHGMLLCFEHHKGTMCNSAENTLKLLSAINEPNVKTYWQTNGTIEQNLAAIDMLGEHIVNVHVFHWVEGRRIAFSKGVDRWQRYLSALAKYVPNTNLLIEFVKGDKKSCLKKDFKALAELCKSMI